MQRLLNYSFIYLVPLLLSAVFSLRSFRLKWPAPYKIFSVFLLFTLAAEVFAIAWKWELHKTIYWDYTQENLWVYNFFLIIRHVFLLVFFYYILDSALLKKLILWSLIPSVLIGIINYFFIETPHTVNNYAVVIANAITILLVLALFTQLLKDKKLIKLSADTKTWISLGLFIYHSGTLPFFIFFNYLLKEHLSMALSYLYINDALNIIMYTLYLIAYLCTPQSQK
jgi:hypothetical protein